MTDEYIFSLEHIYMPAAVDWNDKEQALKALQEYYPKKELWNLEIAYDIFLQSQKEENDKLKEEVDKLSKLPKDEVIVKPRLQDFDGYEYDTSGNISTFSEEESKAMDWHCKHCNIWQPIGDTKANNVERHKDGVYCVPCHKTKHPELYPEEEESEEKNVE